MDQSSTYLVSGYFSMKGHFRLKAKNMLQVKGMTKFVNSLTLQLKIQDIQNLWNTLYSPQVGSAKENQAAVQWWKYY